MGERGQVPVWAWVTDGVGLLVLPAVGYGVAVLVRRWVLAREGGTFAVSFRDDRARGTGDPDVHKDAGGRWMYGLGRYSADVFECFRIFSLSPRPRRRLARSGLTYLGQRTPRGLESESLHTGQVVITCATGDGLVDLALPAEALTGFVAWLEAAPPGRHTVVH